MTIIIHVNLHTIRKNNKTGERNPPIAIRKGKNSKAEYVNEYSNGNFKIIYSPDKPLKCGAKVWVELED